MSWVKEALAGLERGRAVVVRPRGGSMRGRIEDGQRVTIAPRTASVRLAVDDVVFVRMRGNYLLHRIVQLDGDRLLIGNNVGGINGWASARDVYGVVTAIEGRREDRVSAAHELIDIGVNLGHRQFERDRDAVIDRAIAAGVRTMVVTGTTVAISRNAAWLAKSRPGVLFATAGVHPHHAKDCGPGTIAELRALARGAEVVAIGECGLDFNRSFSPHDVQEKQLEAQLELAQELAKPVFMHERDAFARFAAITEKHRPRIARGVVHCFTGTVEQARRYLEMDLHLGITGWICDERRGKELREAVRAIPLERMMLETDAPFLYPRNRAASKDERRNEPAFLPSVLEVVAKELGRSQEEVAKATTATAKAFFGL